MSERGTCMANKTDTLKNNTFLFSQNPEDRGSCYHCIRIFVRTPNILEKQECKSNHINSTTWNLKHPIFTLAGCVTLDRFENPTLENVCRRLDSETQIITLFAENYVPLNCRSSLEGVFHFAYQVVFFVFCHRWAWDWVLIVMILPITIQKQQLLLCLEILRKWASVKYVDRILRNH